VNPFALHPTAASCTGECQKSGPLGLLVILLLCVACYFLFKSLSGHLRRVRDNFPAEGFPVTPPTTGAPGGAAAPGADLVKRAVVRPAVERGGGSAPAVEVDPGPDDRPDDGPDDRPGEAPHPG
jgi:hypothetical protein